MLKCKILSFDITYSPMKSKYKGLSFNHNKKVELSNLINFDTIIRYTNQEHNIDICYVL